VRRRPLTASLVLFVCAAVPVAAQVETEPVVLAPVAPLASAAPAVLAPSALAPLAVPLAPALSAPLGASASAAAPALLAAPAASAAPLAVPSAAASAMPEPPAAAVAPAVAPAPTVDDAPLSAPHAGAVASAGAAAAVASAQTGAFFDGALERRAFDVPADQFPGGSGGVIAAARPMRALLTRNLAPSDLPYDTNLRPALEKPSPLPATLDAAPRAKVRSVSDVAFASEQHSGSAGLVRLAYLDDGRPVAVKAYHLRRNTTRQELDGLALDEARSAQLLSDLGVGPRFHGLWLDADGDWNVVFDIARGDFNGTPVNAATFRDLEIILSRLRAIGLKNVSDFQLYRSPEGRLTVIDPGSAATGLNEPHEWFHSPADEEGGFAAYARLEQLHDAPPDIGRAYLLALRQHRPAGFAGLSALIVRRTDAYTAPLRRDYADLLGLPRSAAPRATLVPGS
jgi:hypothetical protein